LRLRGIGAGKSFGWRTWPGKRGRGAPEMRNISSSFNGVASASKDFVHFVWICDMPVLPVANSIGRRGAAVGVGEAASGPLLLSNLLR